MVELRHAPTEAETAAWDAFSAALETVIVDQLGRTKQSANLWLAIRDMSENMSMRMASRAAGASFAMAEMSNATTPGEPRILATIGTLEDMPHADARHVPPEDQSQEPQVMGWEQRHGAEVYVPRYRVEPYGNGFEPQMEYMVSNQTLWLPLNAEGYILEPDLWNKPKPTIERHTELSEGDAIRAITCARRINGEATIRPIEEKPE